MTIEYPNIPAPRAEREASIRRKCSQLADLLIEKNARYGDSALSPIRIFSKEDPDIQLLVRMDDKLSRINNQAPGDDEDPYWDLAGYLVLYLIAREEYLTS